MTDRDRVVAELVPPREGRSPSVADAVLAELVRKGWVTPAAHPLTSAPARAPVTTFDAVDARAGPGSSRPLIYLDSSVALAQLFAEDRKPSEDLWGEPLTASRLLQYEVWTRVHARRLERAHGEAVPGPAWTASRSSS